MVNHHCNTSNMWLQYNKIVSTSTLLFLSLTFSVPAASQVQSVVKVKEIQTRDRGVVVSAHPLASEAGARVLRMGGNAFDAAIATQFALAVVYPQAGNIGGGGFMVGHTADGKNFTLDYRETAPGKAHPNTFIDKDGKARTDWSQDGHLAAGVPGSARGMEESMKYAKLPWKTLVAPAIELAEKGFAVTAEEARLLNEHREYFVKLNAGMVAFVKEQPWKEGDILVQKELAETLKRIAQNGAAEFYTGQTASLIAKEMQRGKGLISAQDLKNYRAVYREPLKIPFKDVEIYTMGLPSSGGIILGQILYMLQKEDISKHAQNSPEAVQLMVEAERRAYADRAAYMGDPAFTKDYTSYLLSPEYLDGRWKSFTYGKPTPSSVFKTEKNAARESDQTTHLSVYDKWGNAASVTTTLNGYYGSKVVVQGAGFLLNNEMDDFSIKPGVANMFGAVGGEANKVEAGKRMLSSMTPTIILKDKKPYIIVGTPGGTTIPTSVLQALVNKEIFKTGAYEAVNSPKFHHQWLPEVVYHEADFPKSTLEELRKMGYTLQERAPIGRTEMIVVGQDGEITAVADKRGDDSVAVE